MVEGKKTIYTLKLLPKHMKETTKCHAYQGQVVVESVETLDVGWRRCIFAGLLVASRGYFLDNGCVSVASRFL
jgi:hypothetical protein